MTSILNSKTRRVSIAPTAQPSQSSAASSAPRPVLQKSNSVASGVHVAQTPSSASTKKFSSLNDSSIIKQPAAQPEIVLVKKEKEALEQQLASQKRAIESSEQKNAQLVAHIAVLEDLLDKKNNELHFVEAKLEQIGLDPICVRPFENGEGSLEFQQQLRDEEARFEEKLQFLREGLDVRRNMLDDTIKQLQLISQDLQALEEE